MHERMGDRERVREGEREEEMGEGGKGKASGN